MQGYAGAPSNKSTTSDPGQGQVLTLTYESHSIDLLTLLSLSTVGLLPPTPHMYADQRPQ